VKVLNLTRGATIYTSNVYLITGTWNALDDVNTLIDVGRDPAVLDKLRNASTGVGKKRVEQVVLTHNHYDHCSLLPRIKKEFNPVIYAFSPSVKGVDFLLKDGASLKIGDCRFEILHTPCHSRDSICLYCARKGALFTGDTPVIIHSAGGTYENSFLEAMNRLCRRDIQTIYPGHGEPIFGNCNERIKKSRDYVQKSLNGS